MSYARSTKVIAM